MDVYDKDTHDLTILGERTQSANTCHRLHRRQSQTPKPITSASATVRRLQWIHCIPIAITCLKLVVYVGLSPQISWRTFGVYVCGLILLLAMFWLTGRLRCYVGNNLTPFLVVLTVLLNVYYLVLDRGFILPEKWIGSSGVLCVLSGVLFLRSCVAPQFTPIILISVTTVLILLFFLLCQPDVPGVYKISQALFEMFILYLVVITSENLSSQSPWRTYNKKSDSSKCTNYSEPARNTAIETRLEAFFSKAREVRGTLEKATEQLESQEAQEWVAEITHLCCLLIDKATETTTSSTNFNEDEDLQFVAEYCGLDVQAESHTPKPILNIQEIETIDEAVNFGVSASFQVFTLRKYGTTALTLIAEQALYRYGFCSLGIAPVWWNSVFDEVQKRYAVHPFHSPIHAIDVTHQLMLEFQAPRLRALIDCTDSLALFIAGLTHDIAHPGLSNRLLLSALSETAAEYNDSSVVEHMSLSVVFTVFRNAQHNITSWSYVRKLLAEIILSGDMHRHFQLLGQFKVNTAKNTALECDKTLAMQLAFKVADLAFTFRSTKAYLEWADLLSEEFFQQGDLENKLHFPVSMYCDRWKESRSKLHKTLILHITLPLLEVWVPATRPTDRSSLEKLKQNLLLWEPLEVQVRRRMLNAVF